MPDRKRQKSPRAPSIALGEAIERAKAIYDKEQRHAAPTDVIAQDLGYKSANNGAALSTIASLSYYGLLERPEPGKLAVSADLQSYHYAPDEKMKRQLVLKWLLAPPLFRALLEKYGGGLPSDATIRHDLIQEGFKPATAESALKAFKESVEFASYYQAQLDQETNDSSPGENVPLVEDAVIDMPKSKQPQESESLHDRVEALDRIPVRLDAKRRAWLEIPYPFYESDKRRLKAQIDLLLTDTENDETSEA